MQNPSLPLWRSTQGFKLKNEGNHVVLFTFGNKLEVDRILSSEPWSFDKHLMIVQYFNKDVVLSDSDFHFATF